MTLQNKSIADHWILPVVQKLTFRIDTWNAWSSNMISNVDWELWSNSENLPNPFTETFEVSLSKGPSVSFLPITLRKKLSAVSKVLLYLCNQSLSNVSDEQLQIVFSSRYGEAGSTVELLESLANEEPSSPMVFSRSVHNFSIGLNSIATKNYSANTAIAAMKDTFFAGLTESLIKLYSSDARKILFVYAEDSTHHVFRDFYNIPCPFGVAFVLEKESDRDLGSMFHEFILNQDLTERENIPDSLLFLKNVIEFKKKRAVC